MLEIISDCSSPGRAWPRRWRPHFAPSGTLNRAARSGSLRTGRTGRPRNRGARDSRPRARAVRAPCTCGLGVSSPGQRNGERGSAGPRLCARPAVQEGFEPEPAGRSWAERARGQGGRTFLKMSRGGGERTSLPPAPAMRGYENVCIIRMYVCMYTHTAYTHTPHTHSHRIHTHTFGLKAQRPGTASRDPNARRRPRPRASRRHDPL